MKTFVIILALVSFNSFSAPKWISKINSNGLCDNKKEVCAIGEAESLNGAKRSATIEIMKFFKTQIKSEYTNKLSNMNGSIYESATDKVEEVVEGTIKGVEFRKTDEDNLGYYALAVLNKRKAARLLEEEIDALDEKIIASKKFNDQKSIVLIEDSFINRELLLSKYQLLSSKNKKSPISFSEIEDLKRKLVEGVIVKVEAKGESNLIEKAVLQEINSFGYKVSTEKYNRRVIINLEEEKLYLKVEGFVKYKFDLEIQAFKGSENISTIKESFIEVGRNKKDAKAKIVEKINEYIKENLKKLSIK